MMEKWNNVLLGIDGMVDTKLVFLVNMGVNPGPLG
jgi:hypothetical protein